MREKPVQTGSASPRQRSSYAALALPVGWGLLWVAALADLAPSQTFTAAWFAFGTLACLAAVAVISAGGQGRVRVWAWAIAAIPASFLGPLAAALLLVPTIRHDLARTRLHGPRSQQRVPYVGPMASRARLIGTLLGSIAIGVAIFLGILFLAVLGGVHRITSHELHVILLISVVPAAGAVLGVSWQWTRKGPDPRTRAAIAIPTALLAQAVLWAATVWMWGQS